jgi:hypothetical protein
MKKDVKKIVSRIHSTPAEIAKVLITIAVYAALFLTLLHTGLVKQKEFLQSFSSAFLATWFLCGLLALLLILFLLKDVMGMFKELFINTAESIYGSMVLVSAFSLAGYLYSIPASRALLGQKRSFLVAFAVYCIIAVYIKKTIDTMAETRRLREKFAFVLLVCASFGLTWFVKSI